MRRHVLAYAVLASVLAWAVPVAPSPQSATRLAGIHDRTPFVDMHAHPSRFDRTGVASIGADEIAYYRKNLMDVVVASIRTDAIYSGHFTAADGKEIEEGTYRPKPGEPLAFTLERLTKIVRTVESGGAVLATSPAFVSEARRQGKVALVAALEGADGLEGRLGNLNDLYGRGLRLLQLVHVRANEAGHSQSYPYSPGGLTTFGYEAVREANRLGIIVDLADANTETIMDALRVSQAPIVCSHTGARALDDRERYLTDGEIKAVAINGGVIGVWPDRDGGTAIAELVRHIAYVRKLVGVDHVGIGTDLGGMSGDTNSAAGRVDFQAVGEALISTGFADDEVGKVMGGNMMRVWQQVMDVARK